MSINLNELFNSLDNSPKDKEIITETKTTSTPKEPKLDFDSIVTEWSYRCDKGYPDMKNKSDMIKLQEILDEMGIKAPFKRITELTPKEIAAKAVAPKKSKVAAEYGTGIPINKKDNNTIIAFKKKLSNIKWENPDKVNTAVLEIFYKLGDGEQKQCVKLFQKSDLDTYTSSTWTVWRPFFNINPTGMGRGEAMSVMAVAGASSGGTQEKDLKVEGEGTWEIKEQPDSIRLAKSGAVGKFNYANSLRSFYTLLKNINLDDKDNDAKLKKNLLTLIGSQEDADRIFNILVTNFRGEGFGKTKSKSAAPDEDDAEFSEDNFFERVGNMTELPLGVIELHYLGFKALNKAIDSVKQNKDLLANAKLILRTPGDDTDPEFYINPKDAEKIKKAGAKDLSKVDITIAKPATKSNVKFLYAMLDIMRHEFVKDPDKIPKDFVNVLNKYFMNPTIEGILWFFGKKPKDGMSYDQPSLGRRPDWTIYGISQSQAKVQRLSQAELQAKSYTFMRRQIALTK